MHTRIRTALNMADFICGLVQWILSGSIPRMEKVVAIGIIAKVLGAFAEFVQRAGISQAKMSSRFFSKELRLMVVQMLAFLIGGTQAFR